MSREETTAKILEKLKNDPSLVNNLDAEKLADFRKKINPYNISLCEQDTQYLAFSYTLPQYEYLVKQLTVSMIGFLNAAVDEWNVPPDVPPVSVYDYVKNPNIINEMTAEWKHNDETREKLRKNEQFMQDRIVVKRFLEYLFQYDPHEHVRSSYSVPDPQEDREDIPTPAGVAAIKKNLSKDRVKLLQDARLQKVMNMAKSVQSKRPYTLSRFNFITDSRITEEKFRKFVGSTDKDINIQQTVYNMIPPVDTFHKFRKYCDTNHEKIVEATDNLYSELHDFNIAILPIFAAKQEQAVKNYVEKYKSEMMLPVTIAQTGKWTILESFKKNRDATDYISKDSLLLRRMMDKRIEDGKIGKEMIEKQSKKNRAKSKTDKLVEKWQQFKKTETADVAAVGGIDLNNLVDSDDDDIELPIHFIGKGGLTYKKEKVNINTNE